MLPSFWKASLQILDHCLLLDKVSAAGASHTRHASVFPRTATMLIFQFAAVYEVKEFETEQRRRSWAATVVGPIAARRTRLILRDLVDSLDVLFRPLGMYGLFGVPISPLTGGGGEGPAVFGPQISSLYQRLGNAESSADRVQLLDRFFLHRLQKARPLDLTARAVHRLASGGCNVGDAARMIGISERQFERRSQEWARVSPKALARVSRVTSVRVWWGWSGKAAWTLVDGASLRRDYAKRLRV